ncbi:MAG: 16S rRNA (guanine(527)-N(7))-methyltransferase RsmG [Cytophagaceae bacterium]
MDLILKYFPNLSTDQQEKFLALQALYREWNDKINVISRKDIDQLYERHVLHSLGIAKVINFKPRTSILDVGTGGGFPGIPLAIMFQESEFLLIDSIGKKIKVVEEVSKALGLKNLNAQQIRAEQVNESFDFVVSRAVTDIKTFYAWVQKKFLKGGFNSLDNGILYLKGGDLTAEFKEFKKPVKEFALSNYFSEDFFETKKVIYVNCSGNL